TRSRRLRAGWTPRRSPRTRPSFALPIRNPSVRLPGRTLTARTMTGAGVKSCKRGKKQGPAVAPADPSECNQHGDDPHEFRTRTHTYHRNHDIQNDEIYHR